MALSSSPLPKDFDALVQANAGGLSPTSDATQIFQRVNNIAGQYISTPQNALDTTTTQFGVLARLTKSGLITENQREAVARLIDPSRSALQKIQS